MFWGIVCRFAKSQFIIRLSRDEFLQIFLLCLVTPKYFCQNYNCTQIYYRLFFTHKHFSFYNKQHKEKSFQKVLLIVLCLFHKLTHFALVLAFRLSRIVHFSTPLKGSGPMKSDCDHLLARLFATLFPTIPVSPNKMLPICSCQVHFAYLHNPRLVWN